MALIIKNTPGTSEHASVSYIHQAKVAHILT